LGCGSHWPQFAFVEVGIGVVPATRLAHLMVARSVFVVMFG
jgi:hypothetical protein